MKNKTFVYIIYKNDKFQFPMAIGDTLKEISDLTGFNYSTIKNAINKNRDIAGDYHIEKVDIREPEEKWNKIEYRKFCEDNNYDLSDSESLHKFHVFCYGC